MRLLMRGAATAIATMLSVGANAADLDYPPPPVGQPSQVIIVPGPTVPPQYPSAAVPPPPVGPYPYGVPPPIPPRADLAPPANCPPIWRCGLRGCAWQPGCIPPQQYSDQHD